MKKTFFALIASLCFASAAHAAVQPGDAAPDFKLSAANGGER